MKIKLAEYRVPLLLLAVLLLFQAFHADLSNPYKKPIAGDAKGYYAYLPAVFIYQDLDYTFIPGVEKKYYVPALAKSFVKDINGEKVNKTFPGVTVLYLPFFLVAHGISLLFGLPADGYAYTYQLFHLVGFWFYFFCGMLCFRKVLIEMGFVKPLADLSLVICVLGTNIVFFTVYDASVTHIYNFFMVNAAVLLLLQLKQEMAVRKIVLLAALLALIGITRPTNFLVIFVLFFFVPDGAFYKQLFKVIFQAKNVSKILLPGLVVLSIPFIFWKLQTGRWVVYSYGEEGFNFARPELLNFLFSYTKGWFVYTPIAFFSLVLGLILLFKTDRKRAITGLLFFALSIYIFASWWCWYYGAGMGQRVMIDYTILLGFLVALLIAKAFDYKWIRRIALVVTALLISLNIVQAYQVGQGILPMGSPTKEQYWNNFLSLQKKARVYPQEHWELLEENKISLERGLYYGQAGWRIPGKIDGVIAVSDTNAFSPVAAFQTSPLKKGSKIVLSFEAKVETPVKETRLVVTVKGMSKTFAFFISDFAIPGKWVKMEFMVEPDDTAENQMEVYFWNAGSTEKAEFRNMHYKHYFTDEYF
jgi:hypothetical protein